MNRAEEDYIKTIYELTVEKRQSLIKSNELSERLGFSDQSVNEMVKKLEAKNLVAFIPYKGISLTSKGKKVAIRMVRSHRIWEVFLTTKLDFPWESVHEDAEKLEHATSDQVLLRLYEYLGKPKFCQHGNPIPDFEGNMEPTNGDAIDDMIIGDVFEITRVLDFKELLIHLNQQNIKLHDQFQIIDKDQFSGIIKIKDENTTKIISSKIAKMIFGKKVR
ncbi:MAG: metal-dependent transcriptional regulator [Tenericutes bacterium]|nr:metal-dependent transcriptional regulator [Mycoplasmatota bacterium]